MSIFIAGLIQRLRRSFLDKKRRDHEPRIGALLQVLGLGHHPAFPAPGLERLIAQLGEDTGRLLRLLVPLSGLLLWGGDGRDQPRVLRQADDVIHAVVLAPTQDLLAAEPTIAADDDLD